MIPSIERRSLATIVELRAAKEGSASPGTLTGYAAKFNVLSEDLGGFVEMLAPNCFAAVLQDDCRCLRNHLDDALLGRTTSGTLTLKQDDEGLQFECDLPDTDFGRSTAVSVARRDITGCSFQFRVAPDGAEWSFEKERLVRTIKAVARLYDVGPVTYPAYTDTEVDVRSLDHARAEIAAAKAAKLRPILDRIAARVRVAAASL